MAESYNPQTPEDPASQPVVFLTIEDRLFSPVLVERPSGLIIVLRYRRGINARTAVTHVCPLLDPREQWPWRRAFVLPPWPADPMTHMRADIAALTAEEENVPAELILPE